MKNVQKCDGEDAVLGDKEIFSTGELAALCHLTKHTIISAIEKGELIASRTPGGHNRIRRAEALDFMRRYNILPGVARKKILVVDDEPFIRDVIEGFFLGQSGKYHVLMAATGYEAGKLAEREKPDLILLDIKLPDIDGREVCSHIREEEYGKSCRILAVTAMQNQDELAELAQVGIDDYITKPFSLELLKEKVEALLSRRGKI